MKIQSWLSHKTDDWRTPSIIYETFMKMGYFDPCPYQSEMDGLCIDWKKKNFVNPPYSRLKEWIMKAIEEHRKGNKVVLLIPARTDTKAFKMLWTYGGEFGFIIGRLRFNDLNPAPFPSMLVDLHGLSNYSDAYIIDREDIISMIKEWNYEL